MSKLVRTRAGIFTIQDALRLEEIAAQLQTLEEIIKPMDYPIMDLPVISVDRPEDLIKINNGNPITTEAALPEGLIRVTHQGVLIAMGKGMKTTQQNIIQPVKVFK